MLLAVMVLVYSGWVTLPLPALSFLYYCALAGGMLLAWRFHTSRIFLVLLVLFLASQAMGAADIKHLPFLARALAILVPLDFVMVAFMHERGFAKDTITPPLLFLSVQAVIVTVLYRSDEGVAQVVHSRHAIPIVSLSGFALLTFGIAIAVLLARFLATRKPGDSALLWSLAAFFLSLDSLAIVRTSTLYSATAACILAVSIIENSYLLAYHDELTALPSRRAFNDALLRLQEPYSIAVVDIDHFKRFNDTYGHDTGDQVLRLVASNLARVTGGGQAYRCGGEEFTILFPGKTAAEVLEHAEKLRAAIESSEFHTRGNDRRSTPRGAERRNQRSRNRTRKGDVIRELAKGESPRALSVTVSIGVATSTKKRQNTDAVLKAADKALYRAKENGRNRVETILPGARTRVKAAGIA